MTTHEEQVESGKKIVREMLANLATQFHESRVNDLTFTLTDQDFDYHRISLVDPKLNIVAKIGVNDLADCPDHNSVRKRLESQLRQAVQAFYKPEQ
ncbi:MAG: hypothetical protein ABSA41_18135 [Terriglobia bacterium]|jgi:hypothetical protein